VRAWSQVGHTSIILTLMLLPLRLAAAVEPWTDERLSVRSGLVLWLDASRQDRAFAAHGLPGVPPGGSLSVWFDGSGRGAHLVQRSRDAWPRLLAAGGKAAVHFDGKDDYLECAGGGPGLALGECTVFAYAAAGSNPGRFPGLLAVNQVGRRDYQSGFTLDLGPRPTELFESLNLEGKGFGGATDLMNDAFPLGTFHTIEGRVGTGAGGVALLVDGRPQGHRDRKGEPLHVDEVTVGARYYTNSGGPSFVQGFFEGAIAEVLVYDHLLTESEAREVREYLSRKYAVLPEVLAPHAAGGGQPGFRVASPPPVQVLVPGFSVRALPVKLTNINNLKYRHDGKLVALAYDGNIYLLTDHDGDGLEETVATFWDNQGRLRAPIGMDLLPAGDPRGNCVLVSSKGKCSLIVDSDGDDVADREIIVAQGWPEARHGVDALGAALGRDGSVYFGIGTASYIDAYVRDPSGRAHYDLKDERGTILRVAPDFRTRAIVATGIRFPVALRFNPDGDLFATDQEGATWLANGNPFDELLHIQPGRHYGFPPRHSRHLTGVIDEPSVFDYKPQHQSTCGLNFNEPVQGGPVFGPQWWGPVFGPQWWRGDALVSGYSRGKLYRTKLVKTPAGYVAQTSLLAVLQKLTADACVSPSGALVVATHSGGPDWGSGPTGQGTLYQIVHDDREIPQPAAVWAESPRELRIAFDRPLDPAALREIARGATLAAGRSVSTGDRFETLRPGYAVVMAQLGDPRTRLAVHSVQLAPDRRTLILATDPHVDAVTYALALPGMGRPARDTPGKHALPQEPAIDLSYGLNGVQAEWRTDTGDVMWKGWLPHLDLAVARALTAQSAEHDKLWPLLTQPGALRLTTLLDLGSLLRPAVQPGSQVDDTLPPEAPSLTLTPSGRSAIGVARLTTWPAPSSVTGDHDPAVPITLVAPRGEPFLLDVIMSTDTDRTPRLDVSCHTNEDARPRALPLWRFLLPWARRGAELSARVEPTLPAELAGGSWMAGRELFFGKEARCAECHAVRGRGGTIGPDLSNLVHRDYESVLRDIREPGFAINPDHITYSLALADGRVLSGTVRSEGANLRVGDSQGRETLLARSDVEAMQLQPVSTMPEGLIQVLGAARLKDLLTFLLAPELRPAPIHREGAPAPRTRAEVEAVIGPAPPAREPAGRPLRIVLVAGPKDHGVDEHDYPFWQDRWSALLGRADGVTVSASPGWPTPDDFARADVLVLYSANPIWSADKGQELDAFFERGGGLVLLHYAVNGQKAPEELARRIGLAWQPGRSKFRHGPLDLAFTAGNHPITAGFQGLHLVDESYWDLVGDPANVQVLASAVEEGAPRPLFWTRQAGKGRVFCSIPGHYTWTFDDPLFRILILRGIAWSANVPVDRFRDLALQGARIAGDAANAP
jgi:putative heme-binding domain-containing protein